MKLPRINLPRKLTRLPRTGKVQNPFKAGTSATTKRVKRALAVHTGLLGANQIPGKSVAMGALGAKLGGPLGAAAAFGATSTLSGSTTALLLRSVARRGKALAYLKRRGARKTGVYKSRAARVLRRELKGFKVKRDLLGGLKVSSPEVDLRAREGRGAIRVRSMIVAPEARGKGLASKVYNAVAAAAARSKKALHSDGSVSAAAQRRYRDLARGGAKVFYRGARGPRATTPRTAVSRGNGPVFVVNPIGAAPKGYRRVWKSRAMRFAKARFLRTRGLSRRALEHFKSGRRSFDIEASTSTVPEAERKDAKRKVRRIDRVLPYLTRRASRAHNVEW